MEDSNVCDGVPQGSLSVCALPEIVFANYDICSAYAAISRVWQNLLHYITGKLVHKQAAQHLSTLQAYIWSYEKAKESDEIVQMQACYSSLDILVLQTHCTHLHEAQHKPTDY